MKRISAFVLLLFVSISSCKPPVKKEKIATSPTRFFSDDSFWNQPIEENPAIDSNSTRWIQLLETDVNKNNFGINLYKYTIPVYETDSTVPSIIVKERSADRNEVAQYATGWYDTTDIFHHGPDFKKGVPIPGNIIPDPDGDAHIAIIDRKRKLGWDMWGAKKINDTCWSSYTGMMYRLDGPGVYDPALFPAQDDQSIHCYGPSRASGVPAIAGLIMYEEVIAGEIKHKIAAATAFNALKQFTFPAIWTDGPVEGGIPEGAVLQLDPALDLSQFDLLPGELAVAKALQKYGIVNTDNAGGSIIYAEGLYGKTDKSWKGILRDYDGGLVSIPLKHYRVLQIKNIVNKGFRKDRSSAY